MRKGRSGPLYRGAMGGGVCGVGVRCYSFITTDENPNWSLQRGKESVLGTHDGPPIRICWEGAVVGKIPQVKRTTSRCSLGFSVPSRDSPGRGLVFECIRHPGRSLPDPHHGTVLRAPYGSVSRCSRPSSVTL